MDERKLQRFVVPLCKKRVSQYFLDSVDKLGKEYDRYDLTDKELETIREGFKTFLDFYNKIEQEIMEECFENLIKFYKRKRDEINSPYL